MMDAPIWWGRELFGAGRDLNEICPQVIKIAGRMRTLVFGPMLILPAGRTRLTARFALNADAAQHPYILQFIHGDSVAEQRFQPTRSGVFELSLENSHDADAVAALRLWLAGTAFQGDLQFFGARVEGLTQGSAKSPQ